MARKPRFSSIDGQLIAFDAVRADALQAPWPLSGEQKAIWDEILMQRSRGEWASVDLRFAVELAGVLIALHDECERLGEEGYVIAGAGGSKANPRAKVVAQLGRRSVELARFLRIHPGALGHEPSRITGARRAERTARDRLAEVAGNPFLARP